MKLYVESELPVDAATAWEIFESEEYRQRLCQRTQIDQQVLEEREEAGVLHRRIRTEPDRELPGMVSSILGAAKLCYIQENQWHKADSRLDWTVKLEVMTDKVDVHGTTSITPIDDEACRRVVEGEIKVRVPLVGGRIEKAVVSEFESSMKRAVEVAVELMEERGLA